MWYFATWTANVTGSLLGKLPFGDRMIAMNLYTLACLSGGADGMQPVLAAYGIPL